MDSAQQIAAIRRDVAEIKRGRVTHRTVTVTAADPVTSKFSADLPDGQPLTGLTAPSQFLPAVGQEVTLRLEGATPIYDPAGIAADAVTGREIISYTLDDEGVPIEIPRYAEGVISQNPVTREITSSVSEDGDIAARSITTTDPDPVFGGTALSELIDTMPRGIVARGELPAMGITASTDTEASIVELSFDAQPGRSYVLYWPPMEYIVATGDKFVARVRRTTDDSAPSTTSTEVDAWSQGKLTSGFNTMSPYFTYLGSPATPETWRILVTYGTGSGSTGARVNLTTRIRHFFVRDEGPVVSDTGIVLATPTGVSAGGGTTATKKTYTYESEAHWQRTWNQSGAVIADDEMHQGYGDSYNGIRRSSAGWDGLVTLLSGATVNSVEFYLESYYWWNMSGGIARIGYHGQNVEPANFPGSTDPFSVTFTARSQGKWIKVSDGANGRAWGGITQNGTLRGFSLVAPDTSSTYYGKFRGGAYGRPRIRIVYTK